MSISLSLAGLFPPKNVSIWNSELNWQPIPYSSYPAEEDRILGKPKKFCPLYKKLLKKYKKGAGADIFKDDLKLYKYLSKETGMDVANPDDVYDILKILAVEEEWGLKLPNWTDSVWKDKLQNAAAKRFIVRTGTKELKQLASGFFLEKIISDTKDKITGTLKPKGRKMFLYSAHEQNIGHILAGLGLFDNDIPNYGSHLLFEVRLKNGTYGIEIYYQNYKGNDQPTLLVLPGCDSFCPVNKFADLLQDVLPTNKTSCTA
ncbi:venom acid phosphatase Acph-1-like [Agrilus planipennis]|nr:venom acid phosphatase Acph-1-like [Agrilus planipennis]